MSKNPHHRGGFSMEGDRSARFMDQLDAPYLSHYFPDGTIAETKGGFPTVTPGGLEDVAVFTLGRIGGQTRILGASSHHGPYQDRGPAVSTGGFTIPSLGNYGRGWGHVYTDGDGGDFIDFVGRQGRAQYKKLQRTRDGKAFSELYDFYKASPKFSGQSSNSSRIPYGYRYVGDTPVFWSGISTVIIDAGKNYVPTFIMDMGDGALAHIPVPYDIGQYVHQFDAWVLAPGVLFGRVKYIRPWYTPTTIDVDATKPATYVYSSDGGASWSTVTTPPMLEPTIDVPTPYDSLGRFNDAVANEMYLSIAPLSRTQSVVVATVPTRKTGGPNDSVLKVGVMDHFSGNITETQTLETYDVSYGAAYAIGQVIATDSGVLIEVLDVTPTGTLTGSPSKIYLTTSGSDLMHIATLPKGPALTGAFTGADKSTILCPMYDGAGTYTLYSSRDLCASWQRYATLVTGATPPNTVDYKWFLSDFTELTAIRINGAPASSTPLTPWMTDCRIQHD